MSIDRRNAAGWVAIILGVSVGLALNIVTVAILWAAYVRVGTNPEAGLSENGTLLLTGAFGGIIGALSGYLGHAVGKKDEDTTPIEKPKGTP